MKGHIRKRGSSYEVVIYLGRDATTGKKKYKSYTVRGTKKQAEAKLAQLLHELNTGTYVEPSPMTFGEYLDKWLSEKVEPYLRPATVERYRGIVENHLKPALGYIPLARLSPLELQRYYTQALKSGRMGANFGQQIGGPLSVATVRSHHRTIHAALAQAVRWGLVARNVADAVEPPKMEIQPEMRALDAEETQRLLEVAYRESRYPELYVLAVATGMRLGELLGLRWQDIEPPVVHVRQALKKAGPNPMFAPPKTQHGVRVVWLPPSAVAALESLRVRQQAEKALAGSSYEDHDLVFAQANGRPLNGRNLTRREFKRLLSMAKLPPIRFHDLRHTHATLLLGAGVPAKVVSSRLGHSQIGITLNTYSHVLPSMQEEAADKLEDILFKGREGAST